MRRETGQITEEMVKENIVLALTDSSMKEQLKVNEWCLRSSPSVTMIVADVKDLRPKFTVIDTTWEDLVTAMLVSQEEKG